jgi:uncharacterized protein YjbI with pentapeptide repeats
MKPQRKFLKDVLNDHSLWSLSLGKEGILADFKNLKLDKANLIGANLPYAKLQFTSLKGANLSGINFRQADLLNSSLVGANLDGADLEGANLSGVDFSFSKCMGANFADANLEGANFEEANLEKTDFTRAILRGANFKGANLLSSEMIDANLQDANFERANMKEVNFGGANLDKTNFEQTDFKGFNVKDTNFAEADNENINLTYSALNQKKSPEIAFNNNIFDNNPYREQSIKSSKENLSVDLNAVNPTIIEEAIDDLMKKLKSSIQIDQLKAICKHQHFIESIDKIDFKKGDLAMYDGQVVFKLGFNITYNLELLVDRKGKFINVFFFFSKQIEK